MAKMTKAEAVEMLKNRKVYVNGKSYEIQEKLFEIGWKWVGAIRNEVSDTDAPFIFIFGDMRFDCGYDMEEFSKDEKKEISAEEIQSIEIVKECGLKPFDKVLVRDDDNQVWDVNIFSQYDGNVFRCCGGVLFEQCIPYEGNEHLLGTTDNPKDKEE